MYSLNSGQTAAGGRTGLSETLSGEYTSSFLRVINTEGREINVRGVYRFAKSARARSNFV